MTGVESRYFLRTNGHPPADYVGGITPPENPKPEDIHLSRLLGILVKDSSDGKTFSISLYEEKAEPGGETKHRNVGAMERDGILPLETIKLVDHTYTHIVNGVTLSGTF